MLRIYFLRGAVMPRICAEEGWHPDQAKDSWKNLTFLQVSVIA